MRITIENFPPIASGSFELRPLTLFIGPNNTGKSRAGYLTWALSRALSETFVPSAFSDLPRQQWSQIAARLSEDPTQREALERDLLAFTTRALDQEFIPAIQAIVDRAHISGNARIAFESQHGDQLLTVRGTEGGWGFVPYLADPKKAKSSWDIWTHSFPTPSPNPAD